MIVDDSDLALRVVVTLVKSFKDVELVGTASSGINALRLLQRVRADVAVVDLQMPEINGLETCSNIVGAYPDMRVVIMTAAESEDFEDASMAAGASNFVMKNRLPSELPLIVNEVFHQLNPGM